MDGYTRKFLRGQSQKLGMINIWRPVCKSATDVVYDTAVL